MNNDFTLVIQGIIGDDDIYSTALRNIDKFTAYIPNIIVSTWEDKDSKYLPSDVKVVRVPNAQLNIRCAPRSMISHQTLTCLWGVQQVTTPFCIKTRSDEYYGNIQPLIDKIRQHPKKLVTGNVWFNRAAYHPGDHILGSNTNKLLELYEYMEAASRDPKHLMYEFVRSGQLGEYVYGHSFVRINGGVPTATQWKEHGPKHFDVVPAADMAPFLARGRKAGGVYQSPHAPKRAWNLINSIEEIS